MKWRFYFQEYKPPAGPAPASAPAADVSGADAGRVAGESTALALAPTQFASHQNLVRFFKCTEADAGEYAFRFSFRLLLSFSSLEGKRFLFFSFLFLLLRACQIT